MRLNAVRAGWPLLAAVLALPTLLPLGAAALSFWRVDTTLWSHLSTYVLPQVLPTTAALLLGVSLGVSVLGTALALLVALFDFPGRRLFSWALLLPLAIPGYVMATVFVGALDYAGSLATALRGQGLHLPELRNTFGAGLVLVATLYPYVYLVVRGSLAAQGNRLLEAGRSLGLSPAQAVRRVALPMALPAVAAGTLLAAMETLADFGTVAAFNVDTFTSAIYKAWFALFSVESALQLAGVLMLLVFVVLLVQARVLRHRREGAAGPPARRIALRGLRAALASLACALVLVLCFIAPAAQLLAWALPEIRAAGIAAPDARLLDAAANSLRLGLIAAALIVTLTLLLAYAERRHPGAPVRVAARVATLGYAMPGALLAVGLFVPLAALLRELNTVLGWNLAIQGGLGLMLLAYAVRFSAVAHAPLHTALARIRPALDEAAQLQGVTGWAQLWRVHLPPLWPALAAGAALVLVDVMKEMPITLMTRPFGWDTLAVQVFELTSEGQWRRAALPSLAIVAAGLVPVWWLTRHLDTAASAPHGPAA